MLADLLLHASRQSDATGGLRAHGLLPAILPIAADVGDDDIGRELRSAAGIVVRALLLGCGQ